MSDGNPHWYAETKTQYEKSIMAWAGIIDRHIIGPFFFESTVTAESYLSVLGNEMMPELHARNYSAENVVFHQDGAPSHFSGAVKNWLGENFGEWIGRGGGLGWPPRSPDLTPLDFFLWGYIKNIVYEEPSETLEELKRKILDAFSTVTAEMLKNVHENIKKRIDMCISVQGDHFEQLM